MHNIISVIGCSGSGKTTLAAKFIANSDFIVVDTDTIDDANALKIIGQKKYNKMFAKGELHKFWDLKDDMNEAELLQIIHKAQDTNKTIVIVGLTIDLPKYLGSSSLHKYYLKTDLLIIVNLCYVLLMIFVQIMQK